MAGVLPDDAWSPGEKLVSSTLQAIPKNGSSGGEQAAELFQQDYVVQEKGKTAARPPMPGQKLLTLAANTIPSRNPNPTSSLNGRILYILEKLSIMLEVTTLVETHAANLLNCSGEQDRGSSTVKGGALTNLDISESR